VNVKTQNQIVSLLTNALASVLDGKNEAATKSVVTALQLLNSSATTSASTTTPTPTKRGVGRPAGSKAKRRNTRLSTQQIAEIKKRLSYGEPAGQIARSLGVKYQTVYNHRAKQSA
jgi:DNA-binding NarL/FixJ family response regulator